MKYIFHNIGRNALNCFKFPNIIWHLVAMLATYVIINLNIDWQYYKYFRENPAIHDIFISAAVGGIVPIIAPLIIIAFGRIRKGKTILNVGYALAQSAILGWVISSTYKAFTGRAHPSPSLIIDKDITHIFNFGFWEGGIFWGWPSSHTTVAFAMAFTIWHLYPNNKLIKILALAYALFIGIGVSINIHWFSDFIAGAIIGTVIGSVVGLDFYNKRHRVTPR